MKKIIAIIGPPSCGKTTLINSLAKDGYAIIEEQARKEISNWNLPNQRLDFQKHMFQKHVNLEEKASGIVFSDTARYCSVMYADYHGFDLRPHFKDQLDFNYFKVFLLHPQPFVEDGVRMEKNSDEIWKRLYNIYTEFGQRVILLPDLPASRLIDRIKLDMFCQ